MKIPKLIKFLFTILIAKPLWGLLKFVWYAFWLILAAIVGSFLFLAIMVIIGLAFSSITFFNFTPISFDEAIGAGVLVVFCSGIFIAILQAMYVGCKGMIKSIKNTWCDIYK